MPSVVSVSKCSVKASVKDVLFGGPDTFVAGDIHRHVGEWSKILDSSPKQQEIMHYITHKVNVCEFFVPFRGDFQGSFFFDSVWMTRVGMITLHFPKAAQRFSVWSGRVGILFFELSLLAGKQARTCITPSVSPLHVQVTSDHSESIAVSILTTVTSDTSQFPASPSLFPGFGPISSSLKRLSLYVPQFLSH